MSKNKEKEIFKSVILEKFISIDINKLVKADWNYKNEDKFKAEKLRSNIKRNGQIENIIVRELDTGYYEVCNGNHRLDALKELNFKEVVCYNLGKISLPQAQRIAVETNETKFANDNDRLSQILNEIMTEFNTEDLMTTLPFTEKEFETLRQISAELDFDNFDLGEEVKKDPKVEDVEIQGDVDNKADYLVIQFDSLESYDKARALFQLSGSTKIIEFAKLIKILKEKVNSGEFDGESEFN